MVMSQTRKVASSDIAGGAVALHDSDRGGLLRLDDHTVVEVMSAFVAFSTNSGQQICSFWNPRVVVVGGGGHRHRTKNLVI